MSEIGTKSAFKLIQRPFRRGQGEDESKWDELTGEMGRRRGSVGEDTRGDGGIGGRS